MKKPAINYISDGLERQWNNVVYNAEKRVVTLLLSESGTFQGSCHKLMAVILKRNGTDCARSILNFNSNLRKGNKKIGKIKKY